MNKILYHYNILRDWFADKRLGVNTVKSIQLEEHDNIMNFMYEPLPYHQLNEVFRKYPLAADDHFIDLGCGKGRVLIMAAEYGCHNLYGLDINHYLLEIAKENMAQIKRKNQNVQFRSLCMNAKDFEFDQKINKLFFYNPFQLKIFIYVFKSLLRSLETHPRKITMYVCGAKKSTVAYLEKIGCFQLIGSEEKKSLYIYGYEPDDKKAGGT